MLNRRASFLLVASLALAACGGGSGGGNGNVVAAEPVSFDYRVPTQGSDGWPTGHLDDHGFNTERVVEMMDGIGNQQYGEIDSVVIVRDGTLLLDAQFRTELDQFDPWVGNVNSVRHIMHSTSKSFTSALIGIAIDQGYIESTAVKFYDMFNYASYDNWDPRKADMTLHDALTMRLGLEWDEWSAPYGTPQNDLQILTSGNTDFAHALLNLPLESNPGTTYTYNTAATIAIGQALENSVGVPMAEFAETHLFAPLQITGARWGRTPTGLPNGGSGLFLMPRDMVKFGELFITGGVWNGEQVISRDWVDDSVEQHVELSWARTSGYGFQWWLDRYSFNGQPIEAYSTRGWGGQYIFCVPSLNLVVAFTGSNYNSDLQEQPFELMQGFVLAALQ